MVPASNSGLMPFANEAPPMVVGSVPLPATPPAALLLPPVPLVDELVCPALAELPLLELPLLELPPFGLAAPRGSPPLPQATKPSAIAIAREIAGVRGANFMVPPL
jgi:hypothetical protein